VLGRAEPSDLTLLDETGKILWRRSSGAANGEIAICGATIVTAEMAGRGSRHWRLVRYRLKDGRQLSRVDLRWQVGIETAVRLLGCAADGAVLEIYARGRRDLEGDDDPVSFLEFAELSTVLVTRKGRVVPTGFVTVDSTPQFRSPFNRWLFPIAHLWLRAL